MDKTPAIWVFGLMASAILGSVIGSGLYAETGGMLGLIGGAILFATTRLLIRSP